MAFFGVTDDLQDEINDLKRENKKLLKKMKLLEKKIETLKLSIDAADPLKADLILNDLRKQIYDLH